MSNGAGQSPYDFIMNPQKPVKPSKNPLDALKSSGMSLKMKIGIITGATVLLVIIISLAGALLNSGGGDKAKLISLAQTQQLIIAISATATGNIRSQALANSSQTTGLTLKSQQQTYLAYLQSNGIKIGEKQLAGKVTTDITTQLKNAQASSSYDSTYKTLMAQALNNYATEAQTLHDSTVAGPKLKSLLEDESAQVKLLITQLNTPDVTVNEDPGQ